LASFVCKVLKTCLTALHLKTRTAKWLSICYFSFLSQICVWCWHHIMEMAQKDETEGRCPACRSPYDKERIVAMAANCRRLF
jgi:hypothetical protein